MKARPRALHEVFARAVARTPDAVAVDVPPGRGRPARQLRTYAELDADAARIAAALGPDRGERVVAILLKRDSPWLYAAQLGALRAGAAYVGLEPGFPDAHARYVLEDAGASVVLTDAAGAARLREVVPRSTGLCDVARLGAAAVAPVDVEPSHLAYLIYTSGTTGRPKGVMIEHRSIVNLVLADADEFGLGPGDRVAQGSSPAYDSSVEETWLALATGAAVVPMDDDVVRLGPDLVEWLRDERVTVLCPPPTLLRGMACGDPQRALPELRLVYAGGEALPQDLADRWARGRRFVNGYGPTECTVTVVRADVRPGDPVAIGSPVPGNTALVLDAALRTVPDGEWGELCIAGVGLSRGYLGRPERSAASFVDHPDHGRIYRTGDRVRRGARGALFYGGRLDAQVKLRGHRVELEEVEARLAEFAGVREAACAVQRGDVLVAFVVPVDPDSPPPPEQLEEQLRAAVPAHMVPSRIACIDALPTTVGGKRDRKALPELVGPDRSVAEGGGPRDDLERAIAVAWAEVLECVTVPCDVDFFDLGGDSVRAAILVSRLRDDPGTAALTVRDVYEVRTVEGLASRARTGAASPERELREPRLAGRPLAVTAVQTAWLFAELAVGSALAYVLAFVVLPAVLDVVGPIVLLLLAPFALLFLRTVLAPLAIALAVLGKRALIGRYEACREPVFGWWYLRHWMVQRLVGFVPWRLFQGTELVSVVLRALGARVGRGVHVHRGVGLASGGWDLLEIGDGVSIGQDAALGLCELEDGHVVVGPVRLETGATLEVRAGVCGGTAVGAGGSLAPLASLPAGTSIPAGERWDGVPAAAAGRVVAVPAPTLGGPALGPVTHALALTAAQAFYAWIGGLPFVALAIAWILAFGVDAAAVQQWIAAPRVTAEGLWSALAAVVASVPLGLTTLALALRHTRSVPAGVLRTRSALHVRVMARTGVVEAAGRWLSGTVFWPLWLRLAGMRVGRRSEVSTIVDVLPEQVTLGEECFLADGIYLGGPRIDRGTVSVAPVALAARTFLGNHVVVPPGSALPPDVLLGVCTVADAGCTRAGSSWFGHPAFELPRREVVAVDRRLTLEPGPVRFCNRVLWEVARFGLPVLPVLGLLAWWDGVASSTAAGVTLWLAVVPGITFLVAAAFAVSVLVLKWALLGRVRPGQHPLWSCWCSRWDYLYVAWAMVARGVLARLAGTLWLAWYLRAMGARIGRRVALGPGFAQVVDPDMLTLEDGATVDTMFQAHSFEDRVLKIGGVRVGRDATARRASVLLYGADVGDGARVAPHSVVMKNERLLPRRSYAGVPTRPV